MKEGGVVRIGRRGDRDEVRRVEVGESARVREKEEGRMKGNARSPLTK